VEAVVRGQKRFRRKDTAPDIPINLNRFKNIVGLELSLIVRNSSLIRPLESTRGRVYLYLRFDMRKKNGIVHRIKMGEDE